MKSKLYFWLVIICLRALRVFIRLGYWVEMAKINLKYWHHICSVRHIKTANISPKDKIRLLAQLN